MPGWVFGQSLCVVISPKFVLHGKSCLNSSAAAGLRFQEPCCRSDTVTPSMSFTSGQGSFREALCWLLLSVLMLHAEPDLLPAASIAFSAGTQATAADADAAAQSGLLAVAVPPAAAAAAAAAGAVTASAAPAACWLVGSSSCVSTVILWSCT